MFSHLHCHSHFSFGQGASSPEALVEAAVRRGFTTLACTDTNGVWGAVEFQQMAESAGIRPLLGAQLVAEGQEVVVLAENERGWGTICRLVSAIHWSEGSEKASEKSEIRFDLSDSSDLSDREGIVILTPSPRLLETLARTSGNVGLYAELRPGKERHAVLATAKRLGIPPVVTNAVMFANPEDWSRHRLLTAIAANTTLSACPPARLSARGEWLKGEDELRRHFPDVPEALDRAGEIAERCRYRIPLGERTVAPRLSDTGDALERLRALAYAGAERRYGRIAPVTRDRLEHELRIIAGKAFADYFLVVKDIVEHGPTHCGRGSVANSIVSYSLGITHVDPLAAGLLFERFLNPARKDPPDIDLDFPWDERDRVLGYVFQRYPHPRAAMVANHNCFRLRGALREVAKVHGRPEGEIREVTRRMPWFHEGGSFESLLATHPNFAELDLPPSWRLLAREAQPLVGIPRHVSLHPGGVVIVPTTLHDYVPTQPAVKTLEGFPDLTVPVVQFEKDGTEDAGLVKIDLLGNRSLAVIRDGIAMVQANTGRQLDYSSSDAGDDPATRELFRTGQTMGVFYTESPASRLLCQKSQAETFDLLVLNTSIIRPASNRYIRVYLQRLHGAPYQPLDPSLRDTLSETFGVMVYQEDVVNVSAVFAGMPLASGDGLRKALSKKRPVKHLAAYQEEFFEGAHRMGRDPAVTQLVWDMMMSFAGYSFCKGHSCSYIQVAQQSCFLRANYPAEFFAAVLANGGGFYDSFAYVAEAMRQGITILPPDVNASEVRTTGRGREIRIGLQFVKGLSADGMQRLADGRAGGQAGSKLPYSDLHDLWQRTAISAEDLRLLIRVGALDSISNGWTRPMMLWEVDRTAAMIKPPAGPPARPPAQQLLSAHPTVRLPALKEYSVERQRREEYQALGFTTKGHPMDLYRERLTRFRIVRSPELASHIGKTVLCAGMLTTSKPVSTITDEPMEFATFDDGWGLIETVIFPDVYRTRGHVLFDQGPFIMRGKVEEEFGAVTLTVLGLERVERALARLDRSKTVGDGRRQSKTVPRPHPPVSDLPGAGRQPSSTIFDRLRPSSTRRDE
ncbi:MAG TPA: DNA polymerase III subunit alpha [Gemmatimonadales bacterium]|nr:DNA polymerase III subunit alpha [Gemmatimonadales bacterium]